MPKSINRSSLKLDASLLKPISAFSKMNRDELEDIVGHAHAYRYQKDETIYDEGEQADRFFLLLDGFVRITHITPAGAQVIVLYLPPGELFGIAKATGRKAYPARASAASDIVALRWGNQHWDHFIHDYPGFDEAVQRTLGARVGEISDRLLDVSTLSVEKRVAAVLLRLAQTAGKEVDGSTVIDIAMTRQDLSEMTASTLYTISRLVSSWEKLGIIKSNKKKFKVLDITALEKLNAEYD